MSGSVSSEDVSPRARALIVRSALYVLLAIVTLLLGTFLSVVFYAVLTQVATSPLELIRVAVLFTPGLAVAASPFAAVAVLLCLRRGVPDRAVHVVRVATVAGALFGLTAAMQSPHMSSAAVFSAALGWFMATSITLRVLRFLPHAGAVVRNGDTGILS